MKKCIQQCSNRLKLSKKLAYSLFILVIGGGISAQTCQLDDYTLAACNDEAVYTISNYTGNLNNVTPVSSSGLTYAAWTFNPTLGTITFQSFLFSDYKGFGTIIFDIDLGGTICRMVVKVGECCQDGPSPADVFIEEVVPSNTYSGIIWMYGDCQLTNSTEFVSAEVLSAPDARLIVQTGALVKGDNTIFTKMCEYAWDGFYLANATCQLELEECYLSEAIRGVYSYNNGELTAVKTNFYDNLISLLVEEHTTWGPHYRSHIVLDGNTFSFNRLFNYFNVHPSSPIIPSDFFQGDCSIINSGYSIPILIRDNCTEVNIGHRTLAMNTFEDPYGYAVDITWLEIHDSYVKIRTNSFDDANISICSDDDSRIALGGANIATVNLIKTPMITYNTAHHIENNRFSDGGHLEINTPYHALATPGTPFTGSYIYTNDFDGVRLEVIGNNALTQFKVLNNSFPDGWARFADLNDNTNGRLIFNDNVMTGEPSFNTLTVYRCDKMVIGNNTLSYSGTLPWNGSASPIGMDLNDVKEAVVLRNNIDDFERGIEVNYDATGTQFTCNDFSNCYYGFYLNNPSMSSQPATGLNCNMNSWVGCATNIGGSPANAISWVWDNTVITLDPGSVSNITGNPFGNTIICGNQTIPSFKFAGNGVDNSTYNSGNDEFGSKHLEKGTTSAIQLFPNPVSDVLNLDIPEIQYDGELINIYSSTGHLVLAKAAQKGINTINMTKLPSGVYLIRISDFSSMLVKK